MFLSCTGHTSSAQQLRVPNGYRTEQYRTFPAVSSLDSIGLGSYLTFQIREIQDDITSMEFYGQCSHLPTKSVLIYQPLYY